MATGGGIQKPLLVDPTPEVHEIIQPRVDSLLVEIHNIYDSDGIAMGNSESISQDLFPLHNPVNNPNLGQVSITDGKYLLQLISCFQLINFVINQYFII